MTRHSYNGFSAETRDAVGKLLWESYRTGALPKPTHCWACGMSSAVVSIQTHLEDYAEPFRGQIPLCRGCHGALHLRFRDGSSWENWKTLVRAGFQGRVFLVNAPRKESILDVCLGIQTPVLWKALMTTMPSCAAVALTTWWNSTQAALSQRVLPLKCALLPVTPVTAPSTTRTDPPVAGLAAPDPGQRSLFPR